MAAVLANTNLTLDNTSAITIPATPAAGQIVLYPKADKLLYYKDDAGVEQRVVTPLTPISGSIVQVVSTTKTNTFSTTSVCPTPADITGLAVTITPATNTNRVLVTLSMSIGSASSDQGVTVWVKRGSTDVYIGDAAGSRAQTSGGGSTGAEVGSLDMISITFLDSPATTSATTYKAQMALIEAGTGFVNRTHIDQDVNNRQRTASSITVMEVVA